MSIKFDNTMLSSTDKNIGCGDGGKASNTNNQTMTSNPADSFSIYNKDINFHDSFTAANYNYSPTPAKEPPLTINKQLLSNINAVQKDENKSLLLSMNNNNINNNNSPAKEGSYGSNNNTTNNDIVNVHNYFKNTNKETLTQQQQHDDDDDDDDGNKSTATEQHTQHSSFDEKSSDLMEYQRNYNTPVDDEKTTPDHHARRPMNAFLIFCKRHRAIVREKYPNLENR